MRNILVTGANRGIGFELVRQLAENPETANIIATCRNPENAKELEDLKAKSKVKIHILKLDVGDNNDVQKLADNVKKALGADETLTVLINNAGIAIKSTFEDMTPEDLQTSFAINVTAPIMISKALLPSLKISAGNKHRPGLSCSRAAIVNISASFGSFEFQPPPGIEFLLKEITPYRTSKAALNMAMCCLASQIKEDGVLVLSLCPGWVKTDMGGPFAYLEAEVSIKDMLRTMSSKSDADHGGFFDKDGVTIAW